MALTGRRILLGISGGIAAYKTPQLVRELARAGADVQVVMTRGAAEFVTATTLQAVSGRPVRNDLWDPAAEAAMGHIELARWAELVLIAPATAHLIARLAAGAADDLLSTICLATTAPVAVAPAMNQQMWRHPATVRNVARIAADGVHLLGPAEGDQACGEVGPGRMLEPEALTAHAARLISRSGALRGIPVLVTAGPTREPIDPVRYISNHSSGKQGYALARALCEAGAEVTLVSGPVALTPPAGVTTVHVTTAREMHEAVLARVGANRIFVGVAAVADYRPRDAVAQKLKKTPGGGDVTLELTENPDIIAAVARHPQRPFVVGFAAETEKALAHARDKLVRKRLDLIVVNDVADKRIGFASDDNAVTLVYRDSEEALVLSDKLSIARTLVERIATAFANTSAAMR
jgi:phosphopantothenoylcysteine decarboxylase/phosphopantothenate--cysteine ligase